MIKRIFLSLFLVACFLPLASLCSAQPVSGTELITNAKEYDGRTLTYEGEAIGDLMCRGDSCWLNLNDGEVAIGVWLPRILAQKIKYTGSYKERGDWVRVNAVFNRACNQHRGELDLHAQELEVLRQGGVDKEVLDPQKRNLALFLFGGLCLIWILSRLKKT